MTHSDRWWGSGRHAAVAPVEQWARRGRRSRRLLLIASVWVACTPWCANALLRVGATTPPACTGAIEHPVRPGDRFAAILAAHGLSAAETADWYQAARPQADLGHLEPGHLLRLQFDTRGRLQVVRYDVDSAHAVVVERGAIGRLLARRVPLPVIVQPVGARAIVRHSFFAAARQAGLPDAIISQLVDLLSWKVSFKSDVHRGDRFRVLYERRTGRNGRPLAPGRILAVDYAGRTASAAAYFYAVEDGEPVYVDDSGHRLSSAPLRYPLEYTRITSAFSAARFHPILQRDRPHLGVDFAAPAGTPVRAVTAGSVQWAGPQHGFGNHVELDHGNGLVTTYSHLRAIAPGLKTGGRVARGQLLGWVGQTGLATGPHLHFAIFARGRYVDPLTVKLAPPLAAVDAGAFARLRSDMLARLQRLPQTSPTAPSAPESGLSSLAQAGRAGPINLTF